MLLWIRTICALLVYFCGLASAVASPAMIISYGSNNCERFTRATLPEKRMYLVWTEGFMSGLNTKAVGSERMIGLFWKQSSNSARLDDYCSKNPKQSFLSAVESLRTSMGSSKP